jgi:OTU domain-containing protein 6
MAGSKKQKLRKTHPMQPPVDQENENDDLVADLLEHLESRASDARSESTTIPNEAPSKPGDQAEVSGKQGARNRFKARQVHCVSCQP